MKFIVTEVGKDLAPVSLLLEADPSRKQVDKFLDISHCFVGKLGDEVIGVFLLKKITNKETELLNIAVATRYQKHGYGTLLLKEAIKNARELGAEKILLGTGTFGHQLKFYQRLGFRVDSVEKNFFLDNYSQAVYEDGVQHKDMLRLSLAIS